MVYYFTALPFLVVKIITFIKILIYLPQNLCGKQFYDPSNDGQLPSTPE